MTEQIPDVVRTIIKALRTAAGWLPDEQRELLLEAATVAENGGWEDACCPICQEVWCDTGCPLEDLRGDLLRNAEQERLREPPVVTPIGSGVKLVWPGWEPFHRPAPAPGAKGSELTRYADAKHKLATSLREMSNLVGPSPLGNIANVAAQTLDTPTPGHTLPPWEAFRRPVPGVTSSYYQRPTLPEACYTASFGRVHVRPGCRC